MDETDWGLTAIDGADAAKYELFTEKNGFGDGDTLTGKRVAARDLELKAAVMDAGRNAELRQRAKRFFNPKYTYRVYLTYMGTTVWVEAELEAFQAPSKQIDLPQEFSVYFLATDPYWKSVDDFGQDIAAITPRWGFPYMDHPDYGVLVDIANFERSVNFIYDGDAPSYPVITLTADDRVTNPKIVNGSAFVRLIDELEKGDVVELSTRPPRIEKNGQNVLNKVDRSSNFAGLAMQPGTNVYRYEADYGDNSLHVVIRYYKQYLGV
ncbi:phage distal tail protein [Candidatus Allofournierella excrementavium]|uniref:phage distal tail protein n=1 Tax=Candidatus Allofournierella excrementavium TaxID=2838591 RepID=UPI003AB35F53